jgi:hypothetical protein
MMIYLIVGAVVLVVLMLVGALAYAIISQQAEASKKPPADYTAAPIKEPPPMAPAPAPKEWQINLPKIPDFTRVRRAAPNLLFVVLFGGVFTVIGGGMLLWGILDSIKAAESESWPTVQGAIVTSQVASSTDSDGDTTYYADIVYSYRVSGTVYEGDRVVFGEGSTSDYDAMQEVADRYPARRTVTVYYNPDDPADAVLEPGFNWWLMLPLGIGVIFALVGIGTAWGTLWTISRQAMRSA